jgi:hypothetical protein
MAAAQDRSLGIGEVQLWNLLRQRRLIVEANQGRSTLRTRIGAASPHLVCVRLSRLLSSATPEPHSVVENREQREQDPESHG